MLQLIEATWVLFAIENTRYELVQKNSFWSISRTGQSQTQIAIAYGTAIFQALVESCALATLATNIALHVLNLRGDHPWPYLKAKAANTGKVFSS